MSAPSPARRAIPVSVKLTVALRALGLTEADIDWSHEPALGLRAINDAGTDYIPPQHDPAFIFIRPRADHDRITFKDNGTGRGDLSGIAHVKRIRRREADHLAVIAAKLLGGEPPVPVRRKRKIASRGFAKGHRPVRSRNDLGKKTGRRT
jgi:hypothetical protein